MFVFSAGPKCGSAWDCGARLGPHRQPRRSAICSRGSALPDVPAEPQLGAGLRAGDRRGISIQFTPNLAVSWSWRQQDGCVRDLRALTPLGDARPEPLWPHRAGNRGMKEVMAGHSQEPEQGQALTIPR